MVVDRGFLGLFGLSLNKYLNGGMSGTEDLSLVCTVLQLPVLDLPQGVRPRRWGLQQEVN